MPVEAPHSFDPRTPLPMEVRTALNVLFKLVGGERGLIRTAPHGQKSLISALAAYGQMEHNSDHLTFLGAPANEIDEMLARERPARVTVIGSGALQQLIGPLRRNASPIPRIPGRPWWKNRGYQSVGTIRIQGPGSLVWAASDRLLRRADLPYFADRCRIVMLGTLVGARWRILPSSIEIQQFVRTA